MKKNSFDKLIKMYQQGKLSDDKKKLMDDWLNTFQENDTMDSVWKDSEIKALEKSILRKIEKKDSIRIQKLRRIYALCGLVAASIILIIGFWWTNHNAAYKINEGVMISSDQIFPHEDAVILSIGEKIELASDKGGINFSDSELTYEDGTQILTKSESTKQVEWYELNIPKGKQYQATLPDGTKVWLNAASTLKYPSNFNESVREVELQGEAFFDVVKKQYAKDNNMKTPFIVKSATQSIKVLGTQFNISAYSNTDRIETSLLEGVVEVADNNGNRKVLRPNQQSVIDLKKGGYVFIT